MRRLIMEKYDIYIPPETYVLASQAVDFHKSQALSWNERLAGMLNKLERSQDFDAFGVSDLSGFYAHAKSWPEEKRVFNKVVSELYKWIASENGFNVSWVGDKTPLNTMNLELLGRVFPNAKFIFMERDPYDVAASYIEAGIYDDVEQAARRWLRSRMEWEHFCESRSAQDTVVVRYEDLVSGPDVIMKQVGEAFSIPRRNDGQEGRVVASLGDVNVRSHHENVKKKPFTSSIGKGKSVLSEQEVSAISSIVSLVEEA